MKLIVGLGNPGAKYKMTRHNIGFMMLDHLAAIENLTFTTKFESLVAEYNFQGEKILLVKPQTFMNESGRSVRKFIDYYNLDSEDILVIFDDLDLNFLDVKIKYNSSSGGHNGIKSIISHLGHQKFHRLKLGILNEHKRQTVNFVLGDFNKDEKQKLEDLFIDCCFVTDQFNQGIKFPKLVVKK